MSTKSASRADLDAEDRKTPWRKTESEWRDLARAASLTIGSPLACAVERRRFPVGASPTRQPLQPEATGAVMEVTKWLKPLVSVSRYTVTARVCRP
jgi:hypothetical protein